MAKYIVKKNTQHIWLINYDGLTFQSVVAKLYPSQIIHNVALLYRKDVYTAAGSIELLKQCRNLEMIYVDKYDNIINKIQKARNSIVFIEQTSMFESEIITPEVVDDIASIDTVNDVYITSLINDELQHEFIDD